MPLGGLEADRPCAFEQRRGVLAEVHDHRRLAALRAAGPVAAVVAREADERVGGVLLPLEVPARLLVGGAQLLAAPDRVLDDDALLERQPPAEHELAPATVHFMLNARRR